MKAKNPRAYPDQKLTEALASLMKIIVKSQNWHLVQTPEFTQCATLMYAWLWENDKTTLEAPSYASAVNALNDMAPDDQRLVMAKMQDRMGELQGKIITLEAEISHQERRAMKLRDAMGIVMSEAQMALNNDKRSC